LKTDSAMIVGMYHDPTIRMIEKYSKPDTWPRKSPDYYQHFVYKYLMTMQVKRTNFYAKEKRYTFEIILT